MPGIENSLPSEQMGLLDKMLAASTDHIYVFDRLGRFLYASPPGLAALGLAAAELVGKTWRELNFPPDEMNRHDSQRESVFQTGISVRGEMCFPTLQGMREYEYVIAPLLETSHGIEAVISTVRDITEQRRAEAALGRLTAELEARVLARTQELADLNASLQLEIAERQKVEQALQSTELELRVANNRYSQVIHSIGEGIWEYDFNTQLTTGSKRYWQILGDDSRDENSPVPFEDFLARIHPEDVSRFSVAAQRHLEQGQRYDIELRLRHHQGHYGWFRSRGQVIWDEQKRPLRMLGAIEDICDRKQVEQTLAMQLLRIQTLFNTSLDGIVVLDRAGRVLEVNPRFAEMLGYSLEEMAGLTIFDWDAQFTPEELQHLMQETLERTKGLLETQHRRKDGSTYEVEISYSIVMWEGEFLGFCVCRDISERKRSEAERRQFQLTLAEQKASYRQLFQSNPQPMWVYDLETLQFLAINAAAVAKYGYSETEFLAMTIADIRPGEEVARLLENIENVGEGLDFAGVWHHQLKDGRLIMVDIVSHTLEFSGRRAELVLANDVTERLQAEVALQELNQFLEQRVAERTAELRTSEAQIRAIIEAIPDLLLWVTRDGICLDYGQMHSPAEGGQAIPKHLSEVLPPELVQQQLTSIEQAIATGTLQIYEHQLPGAVNPVYEEVRIVGIGPDQALVIVRDISDRKRTEESLQESQHFIRQIADASPNLLYLYDVQHQCNVYSNREIATILGYTADEAQAMGTTFLEQVMHPEDLARLPAQWERINRAQDHEITEFEYRMRQANGEWRWLYRRDVVFNRDEAGQVQQIIGTAQDITNLKQAQQQLAERNQQLATFNQELARATRLKDEFLANMSHELRTPLNAILGMAEGLQEQVFGEVNPQQIKALETIERTGLHLLALINDILDLAKVESGQIELDYAPTALRPLCLSSLDFIKQQALKKQIQIELKLPSGLPDLFVDERRICQVLVNLLNNAVKFTPHGGCITLEVRLLPRLQGADKAEPPWIRFAIRDTGIGIAPDSMQKLFQPFVQIDSALNRQYGGTGLGLALVKRIVELHGGQVGLTSEVGVGSCFTLDLPGVIAHPVSPAPLSQLDPRLEVDQPTPATAPLILLVEDNEDNILAVASYLEAKGNRLLITRNGQDAIALTQTEHPDLILMDIQMPEMDGLEAIRQIRRLPQGDDIPIIALTALAMEGDRERCLTAGANDYLSKPVKLKQLATTIQQLLGLL